MPYGSNLKSINRMENFKFARLCSVTLCGMNEGWVINQGAFYIKDETVANEFAKGHGYESLEDFYECQENSDGFYYTEWTELDEDSWYESEYEDGRNAVYIEA